MPIIAIKPLKRSAPEFMIIIEKLTLIIVLSVRERNTERSSIRVKMERNTELRMLQLVSYYNGFLDRFDSSIKALTLVVFYEIGLKLSWLMILNLH